MVWTLLSIVPMFDCADTVLYINTLYCNNHNNCTVRSTYMNEWIESNNLKPWKENSFNDAIQCVEGLGESLIFNLKIQKIEPILLFLSSRRRYGMIRNINAELLSGETSKKEIIQYTPIRVVIWKQRLFRTWNNINWNIMFGSPPLCTLTLCGDVFLLHGGRWFYYWRNSECLPWPFGVTLCHDPIPVQFLFLITGGHLKRRNHL